MALKHDVVISSDLFNRLCRDQDTVEQYKKTGKFTSFYVSYSMGTYINVKTNDELYDIVVKELDIIRQQRNEYGEKMRALENENRELKSRGFFKRLFS